MKKYHYKSAPKDTSELTEAATSDVRESYSRFLELEL
jgi:hypothetical protein